MISAKEAYNLVKTNLAPGYEIFSASESPHYYAFDIVEKGTHFYREGLGSEFVSKASGRKLFDFEMPDDPEEYKRWNNLDLETIK